MAKTLTVMEKIGKYDVIDKIGSGGFAFVYKGFDPFIKRLVAIKVCLSRDEETRTRFLREAEVAGRVRHPNVTEIHEFGFHKGMPYLVEEYLTGEDLTHLIRRSEPADLPSKVDYLRQIARALEFAHSRGVIHRDVKPSNIRVLEDGQIKIMDFGTAKFTDMESQLTQSGMTLGTVAYLAPERLLGDDQGSEKSDIFSFGVMAYELLSFARPFPGKGIPDMIELVLHSPPVPLVASWPECPPALADMVHRCLEKEPEKRYKSFSEVLLDLEKFRPGTGSSAHTEDEDSSLLDISAALSLQIAGLLERARQQLESGKTARARMLLEEVLEIEPDNERAALLIKRCQEAPATAPLRPADDAPAERAAKVREATRTIETYIRERQLGQAAAALKFAHKWLGDFEPAAVLRSRLVGTLRGDLSSLRGAALRHARTSVERMERLHREGRLAPASAEELGRLIEELDPGNAALGRLHESLRAEAARRQDPDRHDKQTEALLSIERMIDAGDLERARQALGLARRLYGEFDGLPELEERLTPAVERS